MNLYFCEEKYVKMVERIANETGLTDCGVSIIPIGMAKSKEVVKVQKASAALELLTDEEHAVLLYLYIPAFEEVDDKIVQEMWIKMALSQVSYNGEKDKVEIGGPTITVPLLFFQQYGEDAVRKAELAELVIQQLSEKAKKK